MGLNIHFNDDVAARLLALYRANERAMMLAEKLGANARDIALIRLVYQGALADMAIAFGLHWDLTVIGTKGIEQTMTLEEIGGREG